MRQPIRELGFRAAKKLIEEQVLKRHEPQQYTLDCELIIRSSCGPLL
ncbi:hypothetical protein ALTERO38_60710 [Alteromonas sp. 38]|nr:hypothetical protein ALTERO38_60710 [Alteromonas sp. 38]